MDVDEGGFVPLGHRMCPHTLGFALEAWAPEKDECISQAVQALVESFVQLHDEVPKDSVTLVVGPSSDEDLLTLVLDEVIWQVEEHGQVPVDVSIDERTGATEGEVEVRFATVPTDHVDVVGAVPTAVSPHGLRFAQVGGCWRCHVSMEV